MRIAVPLLYRYLLSAGLWFASLLGLRSLTALLISLIFVFSSSQFPVLYFGYLSQLLNGSIDYLNSKRR